MNRVKEKKKRKKYIYVFRKSGRERKRRERERERKRESRRVGVSFANKFGILCTWVSAIKVKIYEDHSLCSF